MTRTRSLIALGCVIALLITALLPLAGSPASAQELDETEPQTKRILDDPSTIADTELINALLAADALQIWIDTSNHAPPTALLRVDGSDTYESLRADVIKQAEDIGKVAERAAQLDVLQAVADELGVEYVALITASSLDAEAVAINDVATKENNQAIASLLFETAVTSSNAARARTNLNATIEALQSYRSSVTTRIDSLPIATVDAYVSAAQRAPSECSVTWTMLAGIGRIESLHGTLNGAAVDAAGNVSPQVFGPLLDGGATERLLAAAAEEEAELAATEDELEIDELELSAVERYPELYEPLMSFTARPEAAIAEALSEAELATDEGDLEDSDVEDKAEDDEAEDNEAEDDESEGNGFAVIEDSDGGSIDGNEDWDRAVGPMQFIPETWSRFDTDGNGDDWADIHNLYDAAASATTYLCHLEQRRGSDPWTFIRGYNDSRAYVADVLETSERFASSYRLPEIAEVAIAESDETEDGDHTG